MSEDFEEAGGPNMNPSTRVLGAARTADDIFVSFCSTSKEEGQAVVKKICKNATSSLSLHEVEKAVRVFTNRNSAYTDVEEQDFAVLVEEVLNNSILSVLVFGDQSPRIGDFELCSLSRAMQYNVSIEALTLSGINVSDDAISLLCEALLRSRVSYLDFSNTPLEDEAGTSIAALAYANPHLRTVVVNASCMAEEIQDEIDVACQFNQSNFEANNNFMDESVFARQNGEDSVDRLKQRMIQVVRLKEKRMTLCVAHLFDCCPNDDMCVYSHDLNMSSFSGEERRVQQSLAQAFKSFEDGEGNGWESTLTPSPADGASWRAPDEEKARGGPVVNLERRAEEKRRREDLLRRQARKRHLLHFYVMPISMITIALSVTTVFLVMRQPH